MKDIARWIVLGALFLIPFLPLYVASDFFFPFITSKGFAFRILIGIAAGAYILLALADKKYHPRFSWVLALYGLFVAWMFVADLLGVNPHKALWSNYERMDGWVALAHAFLFFVVAGAVLSAEKLWKHWWLTALAASALAAFHGLLQIMGVADIHQSGVRVDANFGNAIYFAAYLLFMTGIALWQGLMHKGVLRYGLFALAAVHVLLIFFTATRGVLLGLFGASIVVTVAWLMHARGKSTRTAAGGVLVALALMAGVFFLARDTAFVQNEPTLARMATIFDSKELTVRATLWGMAWDGFLERPITGYGQEGYLYVFTEQYRPSLYAQEPWFDRAHNTYIDWAIAGGLPAILLFLALLAFALRALYKSEAPLAERLILSGIVVGYAIQAVTAFDNLFTYILLAALLAMAHERTARPIPALEKARPIGEMALASVALPAVGVATALVVWMVNVPAMDAGKDLIRAATADSPAAALSHYRSAASRGSFATQEIAEQTVSFASQLAPQQSVPLELRQEAVAFSRELIGKEVERAPRDARIRLISAQGRRATGDRAGFLREIAVAHELSPHKQLILFQMGTDLWQNGDREGAAKIFEETYALEKDYPLAAAYAAAGRIITGDKEGGLALLEEAFGTTAVDEDPVRYAFFEAKMYDELIASAQAYKERTNGAAHARYMLAQAYIVAGRREEARAEIEATMKEFPTSAGEGAALLRTIGL